MTLSISTSTEKESQATSDWVLFMQSASSGNLTMVKKFISSGLNVNLKADDGSTALHCAARTGQTDVIKWLIDHGAKLDIKNRRKRSPLYEAVIEGHADCIATLLHAGSTLPDIAIWNGFDTGFADDLIRLGHLGVVEDVLAATQEDRRKSSILALAIAAARIGRVETLKYLHDSTGMASEIQTDFIYKNTKRQKTLHMAVHHGHGSAVEYLIDKYRITHIDWSLLYVAVRKGHVDVCNLLAHRCSKINNFQLFVSVERGFLAIVKILLYHSSFERLSLDKIITHAFFADQLDIVQYLLSQQPPTLLALNRQTVALTRVETVKCLLRNNYFSVNYQHYGGLHGPGLYYPTLLIAAAKHNDPDLAKFVLEHEDLETTTISKSTVWPGKDNKYRQRTALEIAQILDHTDVAHLLIAHGAINHDFAPEFPSQPVQDPTTFLYQDSTANPMMLEWSDDSSDLNSDA